LVNAGFFGNLFVRAPASPFSLNCRTAGIQDAGASLVGAFGLGFGMESSLSFF